MCKKNKRCAVFLVFLWFAAVLLPVSAQESGISQIYGQIDSAFSDLSADNLSSVLKANRESHSYNLYESYALKKTRQLIIEDNLEFARSAAMVIINNNLENFDAVDLYSYIDKAILNEQAAKQAQENRDRLEAERQAAARERTKEQLSQSYQVLNTASGEKVYISQQQANYTPLLWNVDIGIADFMYQKCTEPDYSSLKYGLSVGGDLFYTSDQFILGGELYADSMTLTMGTGEDDVMTTVKFVPQIAFVHFNKKIFFRTGFALNGLLTTEDIDSESQKTFMTPVLGVGLNNVPVGRTFLAAHLDYYPGHFAYDNLKASFETGMNILVPLTVSDRSTVGIKLGVTDLLFVRNEGIENRAKVLFALGVGNVSK